VSADGRFLFAANRLEDSVTTFAIKANGELKYLHQAATHGDYPREIAVDPSGCFLYSCNQRSDNFTSYRIDGETGKLKFTGQWVAAGSPSSLVFLP
jgi:6-phosphogluconolactonase